MKLSIDQLSDSLYLQIVDARASVTKETTPGVVLHYAAGKLVGIGVSGLSKLLSAGESGAVSREVKFEIVVSFGSASRNPDSDHLDPARLSINAPVPGETVANAGRDLEGKAARISRLRQNIEFMRQELERDGVPHWDRHDWIGHIECQERELAALESPDSRST